MKKLTKTIAIITAGAALQGAYASEGYRFEVAGAISIDAESTLQSELKLDNFETDQDRYTVRATYFSSPVVADEGPRAEAAFITRANAFFYQRDQLDVESVDSDLEVDSLGFHGVSGPWVYQANLDYINAQADAGLIPDSIAMGKVDEDFENIALAVGAYVGPTTRILLHYQSNEMLLEGPVSLFNENDVVALDIKYLTIGETTSLSLDASIGHISLDNGDDNLTFNVGATVYPVEHIAVGVNVGKINLFEADYELFDANIEWFITPSFAVELAYERTTVEINTSAPIIDTNSKLRQISLASRLRF